MRSKKSGFTLIELSIVLVIIGLLVGGILAGQSLIRAAGLRSTITSAERMRTSINVFREKYAGYPGDITNATAFWGAAAGSPSACNALDYTSPATSTETCDGNGNGKILTWQSGVAIASRSERYETFRAWQQLANAGLIQGRYTGVSGSQGLIDHVIGSNVPATDLSNSGMSLYDAYPGEGNFTFLGGTFMNTLFIGASKRPSDTSGKLFTPGEMWDMDTKLDDGKPGLGKVRVFRISLCATSSDINAGATAEYLLTSEARDCTFMMTNM